MSTVRTVPFAVIPATPVLCEGCGKPLDPITIAQCALGTNPKVNICFPCVQARAKTVANGGRCKCGSKRRENSEQHQIGSRRWYTCLRCLGTTRQVS